MTGGRELLKISLVSLIFIVSFFYRIQLHSQQGKDFGSYLEAVDTFTLGKNPYVKTIQTYENLKNDPGYKGFAYLPGFLYLYMPVYVLILLLSNSYEVFSSTPVIYLISDLWKLPTYIADFGIGLILVRLMYRKNYLFMILGLTAWYFNPYFVVKYNYISNDAVTIFFMLLSLYYLKKDSVLSGALYAVSVAFKSFPLLILPIYLLNSKDIKEAFKFLMAGLIIFIAISFPFMLNGLENFIDYIRGSMLVHADRFVQGRPYLYYISYYYKIEFFRTIPFKGNTLLASFLGWFLVPFIYITFKFKEKYALSVVPFLSFYLFTPVLNTTYTIWFLPVFILGLFELFQTKFKWASYAILIFWWGFTYWYLSQWKDGFHIWFPI